MRFGDIEECEACPLLEEGYCNGGMTSDGRGNPIEPPCVVMDPDDDTDDYIDRVDSAEAYLEEVAEREEKKRREKQESSEKAKWLSHMTAYERRMVSKLKKAIAKREAQVSFMKSMAKAFNTTNEMFGYSERVPEDFKDNVDPYLDDLKERLKVAEEELAKKRKEVRSSVAYKRAGLMKKPDYFRNKEWFDLCMEGISCKTDSLKEKCLDELNRNGILRSDGLILFMKVDGLYYLYCGKKYLGYLDKKGKQDKVFKDFLNSIFKDMLCECEVVCFPGFTEEYFMMGYIACFRTVSDFLKAYKLNTGREW